MINSGLGTPEAETKICIVGDGRRGFEFLDVSVNNLHNL